MEKQGLTKKEVEIARKIYGSNNLPEKRAKSFWHLLIESLGDPIIKILLLALVIKIVFLFKDFDWFETIGIMIAIFLSSFISTISEYGSEEAFKHLQEEEEKINVKVKRDNNIQLIKIEDVVTGDIVMLESGDAIPADGILISGSLSVDESRLNGEAKEQNKLSNSSNNKLYRGSVVYDGIGVMEVQLVGDKTMYGVLAKEIQDSEPVSPLKTRLQELAKIISRLGYIGAFLVTFSYLFSVIVIKNNFDISLIKTTITNLPLMFDYLIYSLTLSVTIIVVAVPEGLPMMITLVLSSNMKRMLKKKVLVRKLVGIETTGSMNLLLTDKTGTLTKGVLTVKEIVNGEAKHFQNKESLKLYNKYYDKVRKCLLLNNQSRINSNLEIIGGNTTDRALQSFIKEQIEDYTVKEVVPFKSSLKYSLITIVDNDKEVTYIKGASEIILPKCDKYLSYLGDEKVLFNKDSIINNIKNITMNGSRVITLAYKEKKDLNYVFLGYVVIYDELREEAKDAVSSILSSGIQIIMITGDARETATAIAKEVGIVKTNEDIVLTSDELKKMSDLELSKKINEIKVIARALPSDKSRLVNIALDNDLIVGMTGDGVNDAPALKKANVGFAMGSGTEVAKEASDIVILDDNIKSISEAILYGRTIFKSIRKFIIYQLSCNFCALFLSIIGPFIGCNTPITIIQMLWINMIMDTFAGLAFSFEPAIKETMQDEPKKKSEPIINKYMYSEIIFTGLYAALLCIFFLKSPFVLNLIRFDRENKYLMTAYFALFIFIGIAQAFNARTSRLNLLANIKENKVFILIILFIISVQLVLIYKGGVVFRTFGLTPFELMLVIVLSLTVIPIDMLRKIWIKRKKIKSGI